MLASLAAMRKVLVLLTLSAIGLASCVTPTDDVGRGVPPATATPPELPRLPSSAIRVVPYGTTGRGAELVTRNSGVQALALVGDRRITQRILLLAATGDEPAYLAAKTALERVGVHYRALIARSEQLTAALLSNGASTCYFNGVVISTSGLGYWNPTGGDGTGRWESALTPAQWQQLAEFEVACSAREVVWYAYPGAEFGLAAGPAFDSNSAVDAHLTLDGQSQFVRVRDSATVPYRHAYGYRAAIADPATTKALVEANDGGVLVASHVGSDGRETLVSTVDASPYLTHAVLLEYDFVRWVTRTLFVGKKRAYLSAQIDDIFIDNDMWVVGEGNRGTTQFRITGADVTSLVAWQTGRRSAMPSGSTFITELAFNGVGTQTVLYPDTSLLTQGRVAGTNLTWLNHTWDHENLDSLSRSSVKTEVERNCTLAKNLRLNAFKCSDLVTPDMSGLGNPNAILGMLDAGARFVVSDTSITEALRPSNPGTNPTFNVGRPNPVNSRLYQVPRHPTSIFYDVAASATERDEYNFIYRSYFGRDLTYVEILDKDSEFGLYYLLQGDIDPLMFHQSNLARYTDSSGRVRSLYADWIDAVVAKYLAYSDAPILTLGEAAIGNAMQERGQLNACGLTTTLVEVAGVRNLELSSTRGCTVPITGLSAPIAGSVEVYAGEPTTSVVMLAGVPRTIALP